MKKQYKQTKSINFMVRGDKMKELQKKAHETAVKRGKWDRGMDGAILNLYEEVSEFANAIEDKSQINEDYYEGGLDYRTTYEVNVAGSVDDELADVVIVCLSIAEELGIDLMTAIKNKMRYNEVRGK